MMICAQLDLEPNTPQQLAFLIPYEDRHRHIIECQFQIGYRGLLQLIYRSSAIANFNASAVYEAEVKAGMFDYEMGTTPRIAHKIDLLRPELRTGPLAAAYACVTLKSGLPIMRVVSGAEVEKSQKKSASFQADQKYGSEKSPWRTDEAEMWIKTAIKKLAKWLPQSERQIAVAVDTDDRSERGESLAPEKSATGKLNDALAGAIGSPALEAGEDAGIFIDVSQKPEPTAEPSSSSADDQQKSAAQDVPPAQGGGPALPEAQAQGFYCPKKRKEVTEEDCFYCENRTGCSEWGDGEEEQL
jgi:phage RecT family recombinase